MHRGSSGSATLSHRPTGKGEASHRFHVDRAGLDQGGELRRVEPADIEGFVIVRRGGAISRCDAAKKCISSVEYPGASGALSKNTPLSGP